MNTKTSDSYFKTWWQPAPELSKEDKAAGVPSCAGTPREINGLAPVANPMMQIHPMNTSKYWLDYLSLAYVLARAAEIKPKYDWQLTVRMAARNGVKL